MNDEFILDIGSVLGLDLPKSQVILNKEYSGSKCLYRIDRDGRFNHVHILELEVLSETKTGYWILHPYKSKNKKRFVTKNSQFASTSIILAYSKYKQRMIRRLRHLKNDISYVEECIKDFDAVTIDEI